MFPRYAKLPVEEKKRRARERAKAWSKANPLRGRSTKLMKAFGITHQDYLDLKGESECFICGNACPSGRHLAVDHDHSNGVIRGLLCCNCNKGLGSFREDLDLMEKAMQYLRNYKLCLQEAGLD